MANMFAWWEEGMTHLIESSPNYQPNKFMGFGEGKRRVLQEHRLDLEEKYIKLFRILSRRPLPLSRFEIKQFGLEFKRLSDLFQLYRRYSAEDFLKFNVKVACDDLKKLVLDSPIYNSDAQQNFKGGLEVTLFSLFILIHDYIINIHIDPGRT